jgi:hypothetical protein
MTSHALLAATFAALSSGHEPAEVRPLAGTHRPLTDAPKFVADAKALAQSLVGKDAIVPWFGLAWWSTTRSCWPTASARPTSSGRSRPTATRSTTSRRRRSRSRR